MISNLAYYIISAVIVLVILLGIYLMSRVKTARLGNGLSALGLLAATITILLKYEIIEIWQLHIYFQIGIIIGLVMAFKVKMINMPQMIALLNGLGGLASTIVGGFALYQIGAGADTFSIISSVLAILIGNITFVGSLIAALKLSRIISQKPVRIKFYGVFIILNIILMVALIFVSAFIKNIELIILLASLILSTLFGLIFSLSIGGADMPITISLLNSLSGVAASISGLAIGDPLLVAVGAIVGASGLILTRIMAKAMNKPVLHIIMGKTTISHKQPPKEKEELKETFIQTKDPYQIFDEAEEVIIVPGYGMAVAQAQFLVKELTDFIKSKGGHVRFAIHPVAGRMPGHMNVLLAEVDVDYDDLYDMDSINDDFKDTDLVIIIGANDVVNPSAKTEEGTPLYGMPILHVDEARNIFIFNYDTMPGYSGVDNPLYTSDVHLFLGDAKVTLQEFLNHYKK
ncbi:MAG: NAD(P)(+) transhydrogenase (Re/Si-specific) subunit beta [Acholeplasmataceae bacterium]|jgi:NAD(P) transhydrogenase subunit beta|nr:NAD(P)(+) transhydrogenase (Re/Si-specific) subunit beta [Acholeplasmataceae bacterium]